MQDTFQIADLLAFIAGVALSYRLGSRTSTLGRLPFVGYLLAIGVVSILVTAFLSGMLSASVLKTASTLILCLSAAQSLAVGFVLWKIASARSRDATGKNGWAVRCFLPIIQLFAVIYLAFKPSRRSEDQEVFS